MSEGLQELLAYAGVLLFFLGLIGGVAIPMLRSPRIGLSAHTAAIQSGLALVAVAWLGGRLTLPDGWALVIAHLLWLSLYVLWAGLMLGGLFGTSRTLPIAGAGVTPAKPWQETLAFALIGSSSLGSAVAIALLLWQWSWRAS